MKTWLITLSLLGAAGIAAAADEMPTPRPEAAMTKEAGAPAESAKITPHGAKRLPRGDLRKCLELKDNKDIIRCAETGRSH